MTALKRPADRRWRSCLADEGHEGLRAPPVLVWGQPSSPGIKGKHIPGTRRPGSAAPKGLVAQRGGGTARLRLNSGASITQRHCAAEEEAGRSRRLHRGQAADWKRRGLAHAQACRIDWEAEERAEIQHCTLAGPRAPGGKAVPAGTTAGPP